MPNYSTDILVAAFDLPPEEAIKYFKLKGFKITWSWREVLNEANNKAFVVAKSINMDILQTIRREVDRAISQGTTFDEFRKSLRPLLVKRGWWGKRTVMGPGGVEEVQLGSPHRLENIFRTNVQSAYNAGRWKGQFENRRYRPYLMLIEILDQSTRTTHRSRSGSIAPVDSDFWKPPNSWYPPNGFRCRGRARALTEDQALERGIGIKGEGNPDPGFGGNPGITDWAPDKADYDSDIWSLGEKAQEDFDNERLEP